MDGSVPINRGRGTNLTSSPPKQPPQPQPPPTIPDKEKEEEKEKEKEEDKPPDMNKSNPRLLVNRESIYERQLPGDAYITVYVQRLQHGYYSSSAVSDPEAEHVDFLALSFVFHSPHTLSHRFKSATIRASIQGPDQLATDGTSSPKRRPKNPRILMHAPHLIYGTVSPETMEWTFSLAGSIGISEAPLSANLIPSGSVNSRYRRYEMMRIQGSARTLKSPRGPQFDIEAGEVVWSLEENNLQRSGLPREFTFVMLIQKPSFKSRVKLSLDIDPVIQSWWGNYPNWSLSLPSYRPAKRRDVDFDKEVGQRFEPLDTERGFNFAALVSSFDDYIALPGRKYSRKMEIPKETDLPERQGYPQPYPGQYGSLNPMQGMQGTQNQNQTMQGMQGILNVQQKYQLQSNPTQQPPFAPFSAAPPSLTTTNMANITGVEAQSNNLNVSLGPSHGVAIMNLSALRSAMVSPQCSEQFTGPGPPLPENGRSSNDDSDSNSRETSRVMNMVNRPLTPSLLLLWEERLKESG
ncbi:hypothetical protein N7509_013285 [Penicillium cosmopolitanum]|uniref:Uncharacterized protein n=1 Tax=Penicillium cosmopolitanum TaxID=1131564 RepID=A0A9W9SFR3_9EURO|nr:uncharacterized protein N7509_013285 [Penicillium cosmopolitanum]KAJ5376399.1 hypothetical protein N7509_013285 [Penicillium cosmopolitanum]